MFQTIKNRDLRPGSSHPSIPILKVSAPLFDASDPVPNSRDPEKKRVDFVEQAEHISDSSVKPSSAGEISVGLNEHTILKQLVQGIP